MLLCLTLSSRSRLWVIFSRINHINYLGFLPERCHGKNMAASKLPTSWKRKIIAVCSRQTQIHTHTYRHHTAASQPARECHIQIFYITQISQDRNVYVFPVKEMNGNFIVESVSDNWKMFMWVTYRKLSFIIGLNHFIWLFEGRIDETKSKIIYL